MCCLANLVGLFVVYSLAVNQTRRSLRPTLWVGVGRDGGEQESSLQRQAEQS